jgi:tetratricopeptide (TPR) repeat protein
MRKPIWRTLGLVVLSAALVWLVLVRGYADYLAHVLPERALALNAGQPQALLQSAELALTQGRQADAESAATAVIRAQPLFGPALRVLGAVADGRGEHQRAIALMQAAEASTPRDTATQFWLAINALADKDVDASLLRLDRLLRFEPAVEGDVFPILGTIALNPFGAGKMAPLLAMNPPWRSGFLRQLIDQAPTAIELTRLFREIEKAGGKITDAERDQFAGRLYAAKDWPRLRRFLAVDTDRAGPSPLIHDGAFNGTGRGPLLGWSIGRIAGVDSLIDTAPATGNRALRLVFHDRRVAFRHVAQVLLLPPGNYLLTGRVRLIDLRAALGLRWTLSCAPGGRVLAQSERLLGNSDWRSFEVSLRVPADDCGGQLLLLAVDARIAAEQQVAGEAWFDDFSVVPLTLSE